MGTARLTGPCLGYARCMGGRKGPSTVAESHKAGRASIKDEDTDSIGEGLCAFTSAAELLL